jgi:XRE family transcriptional regulator, regulator of sulfur utilization
MHEATNHIGAAIKSARSQMKLSLDKAAALTGVSKAMLGQIERGDSCPTISTLWKISSGLRISFSRLLSDPQPEYNVVPLEDIDPVFEDEGRFILRNVFSFDPVTGFDYLYILLKPGCDYQSPTHPNVFEEYVLVTKGCLRLTLEGKPYDLPQYSSIKFRGDAAHGYANPGAEEVEFQNVLKYL